MCYILRKKVDKAVKPTTPSQRAGRAGSKNLQKCHFKKYLHIFFCGVEGHWKNIYMNSNSKGLHTFTNIKEVLKLEYTELKLILFSNIINLSVILDLSQSSWNQAEQPKSICSIS